MFNKNGLPTKSFFPSEEEMNQMNMQQAQMEQQQMMMGQMPQGMEQQPQMESMPSEEGLNQLIDEYGEEEVQSLIDDAQAGQI